MAPQVTIKIRCRIGWKLLQEYDNSGNKNTTIKRTVEVTESKEINGTTFHGTVNESSRDEAEKYAYLPLRRIINPTCPS